MLMAEGKYDNSEQEVAVEVHLKAVVPLEDIFPIHRRN
jgi:hypothetical protein